MRKEDTLRLNTEYLGRRIESLGLKQWWLAKQLQVDRKTIARWLGGKVKRIARDNAERLARELDCDLADLVLSDEADITATREEQRLAAESLQQRDLLSLLAPTDDWSLAESLIRATMEPNLPLRSLGALYNLLSIAAWRQGHYEDAEDKAKRAAAIGQKTGDRAIQMKACLNLGTIHSLVGPIHQARSEFETCLSSREYFEQERDYGNALSNVAWLYKATGDFGKAVRAQRRAIDLFDRLGADYNLAIAWTSMGLYHTELGSFEDALEAIERARTYARTAKYQRGLLCCDFYEGDVRTLRRELDRSRALILEARPRLSQYPVFDLTCLEITARFHRFAGDLDIARSEIDLGLQQSERFPTHRCTMLVESARIAQEAGEVSRAEANLHKARQVAAEQGLRIPALGNRAAEYGTGLPR